MTPGFADFKAVHCTFGNSELSRQTCRSFALSYAFANDTHERFS